MANEQHGHGPPSYGALLKLARDAKGWSPETAAANMPFSFSGTTWRHIEAGYRGKERKPVATKPATLAAMAHTVGITAERLHEHAPEAAVILKELERQRAQSALAMPEALLSAPPHVRRMIEAALEDVEPADVPTLLREMAADYEAVMRRQAQKPGKPQRPRRTG